MSETDPFYSEEAEGMSKRTQLEEYFSQSLEVDLLLRLCPDEEDTIYQIVDLLVDTCATNRKTLRIAGDDKPAEVVRSRFMKLNADHIRFVLKLSLIHIYTTRLHVGAFYLPAFLEEMLREVEEH